MTARLLAVESLVDSNRLLDQLRERLTEARLNVRALANLVLREAEEAERDGDPEKGRALRERVGSLEILENDVETLRVALYATLFDDSLRMLVVEAARLA